MEVDFPGTLMKLSSIVAGRFLVHFAGNDAGFGMKVFRGSGDSNLSFSLMTFTSMAPGRIDPPIIYQETNQDSWVIEMNDPVVFRPDFNGYRSFNRRGAPDKPGSFILTEGGGRFVRARFIHGTVDVSLENGEVVDLAEHPGSVWTEDWEILDSRRGAGLETVLCSHRSADKA
ncbi:MAG TPA: hypothetical protein VH206_17515 [Xanthobacteraceae bacterium]|nr:hypothetical protein [Xanthobacteraceae bacterium]